MINFQSSEDIRFACDTVREELQFKHERTGKSIFTLEEMNAHLIAEGLFDATPSISGISEFEWLQNRALLCLIKVVQSMGKTEKGRVRLPSIPFFSRSRIETGSRSRGQVTLKWQKKMSFGKKIEWR